MVLQLCRSESEDDRGTSSESLLPQEGPGGDSVEPTDSLEPTPSLQQGEAGPVLLEEQQNPDLNAWQSMQSLPGKSRGTNPNLLAKRHLTPLLLAT